VHDIAGLAALPRLEASTFAEPAPSRTCRTVQAVLSFQTAGEAWKEPWACPSTTKASLQSHFQERTTLVTACSSCRSIRWRVWPLRAGLTATRLPTGASAVPGSSPATPGRELLASALSSSSGCPCPASMATHGWRDLAALYMAEANLHASVSSHFLVLLGVLDKVSIGALFLLICWTSSCCRDGMPVSFMRHAPSTRARPKREQNTVFLSLSGRAGDSVHALAVVAVLRLVH